MKILRTYQGPIVLSSLFFVAMLAAPTSSFAQGCTNRISGRVTLDGSTPDRRVDVHLLIEQGRERDEPDEARCARSQTRFTSGLPNRPDGRTSKTTRMMRRAAGSRSSSENQSNAPYWLR